MIESKLIAIMHSELTMKVIYSEDDPDYRRLPSGIRMTEDEEPRDLENEEKRLLE